MKGNNFLTIDAWMLSIFGLCCWADDGDWFLEGDIVNSDPLLIGTGNQVCLVPREIKAELADAIARVRQSGQLITHVSVNNRTAALLWLQGALTPDDFMTARETADTVELSIGAMNLPGIKFVIQHYSQEPHGFVIHTGEKN